MSEWLRRHRFLLLLGFTYAYFFQGGDPNQSSRILLTNALVTRHSPQITPEHAVTIDKAIVHGEFYSDKAPGISLLALAPYAVLRAAERATGLPPDAIEVQRARLHAIVVLISGLSGVLAAALVRRGAVLLGASTRDAGLLAFAYALGTLAFPFSTVLFGHQTSAALLIGTFVLAMTDRASAAPRGRRVCLTLGVLWGAALITEYPTALLVAALGLYFLFGARSVSEGARVVAWVAAGAAGPLVLHSALAWWSFGSPFALAYAHESNPIFRAHMSAGFLGIGRPSAAVAWHALVGPYRGLFFHCPVLILTFAGFGAWIGRRERRAELATCAAVCGLSLLLTSGYFAWDGGGSIGPRHMVPALPFFALPITWWLREGRWQRAVTVAAIVPSVAIMLACTAVLVQLPEGDPAACVPFYSLVVPSLIRHQVALNFSDAFHFGPHLDAAYNLGTLVGLGAWASLSVPVVVWLAAYAGDLAARRRAA